MTGPSGGLPGRAASASPLALRMTGALAALLVAGLAFRVIIAYLLPGSGFEVDLDAFRFWAGNLAEQGPWGFYDRPFFHDYTPGYLYVLWVLGYLGQALGGLGDLIKLPAILADLAVAWLVWSLVLELGGSQRRALLGAGLFLFFPITWFDSVVWGQVDSVGLIFVLLALRATWRDQPERAALWGAIAVLIKPQLGIVVPIIAAVVIRRALFGSPPDEEGLDPVPGERGTGVGAPDVGPDARGRTRGSGPLERARAWSRRERGPVRILTTTAVGLGTAAALSAPFGLSIVGLVEQILSAAGGYPYLTVNAYNPWALVSDTAGRSLASAGIWLCDAVVEGSCADPVLLGPFWAVAVGSALVLAVVLAVAWVVARHPDRRTILVGLAIIAIAFFVVPTRVHERYLFPLMAIGAILAALSLRWRVAYLVVGAVNFLNLYVVLTTLYPGNPSISDWLGIGPWIRSEAGVTIIALTHLAVFVWALSQLRPAARQSLAREVNLAGFTDGPDEVPADPDPGPGPAPGLAAPLAPADAEGGSAPDVPRPAGIAVATTTVTAAGPEPSAPAPSWAHPVARIRRQAAARAAIPDRSGALEGEPGGRLDRLDLWVLAVLVIATLVFRVDRLAEPYQMHFDEVYHARTATEFLQHWRYGEPHDIYEYTHPHLAKYAIAAGIVLFGEDRVSATSDLGVPVADAAIERRWLDPSLPGSRAGDRLYVATGDGLRVHDLTTRALVASPDWAAGTTAVAVDDTRHLLYLAGPSGRIDVVDTALAFDGLRAGMTPDAGPTTLATLGSAVRQVFPTGDGTVVATITVDDELVLVDAVSGAELSRIPVADAVGLADGGSDDALVADLESIADPATAAAELAAILGGSVEAYEGILVAGVDSAVIPGGLSDDVRPDVETAIADGRLTGFGIETRARVAVADRYGVTFVSAGDGSIVATVTLDAPAGGMVAVSGFDDPRLYVSAGERMAIVLPGKEGDEPRLDRTFPMPGAVSTVLFDEATRMVHALGTAPDGSGSTIYVIEPNASAVYADARLPFDPAALVLDQAPAFPSADRQQLLALGPDGAAATVEAGRHAFAWRLPGVLAGILAAALVYLLVRVLFRRRAVAVLAAVVVAVDPMLFAQSRIAMNDAYVGLFILAAILIFAALWTGRWRARWAFWVAMPTIGVLLGLALASKWVGAYAIGAVGVLILIRSALGRVLLVLGLLAVTTVFGYQAIVVPVDATQGGNLTFLLLMMGITLLAVAIAVLRPVAWSPEEVRFAIGAPLVAGALVFLLAIPLGIGTSAAGSDPLEQLPVMPSLAMGLMALGGLAWIAFWGAGRVGLGPWAAPPGPADPARLLAPAAPSPPWWLRFGSGLGLPAAWILVSLLVIPLAVYVAAYIPWAQLPGNQLWPGFPEGHTGRTLWDLTISMYEYHDNLRATHPAASPWWAWPLDLKPVWFYQGSFAGGTSAAIYDHGSLVTWWLGIPAMAFAVWQAYRRRSLQLALVVIVFAALWLPWARIDRATFQYHWYTALPFVLVALAYFLAELWHGASSRTWLLARAAAAAAILGPVILWVFKAPLCWFVGVERAYEASPACVGNPGQLVVTAEVAGIALVVMVATVFVVWQLVHLDRPDATGRVDPLRRLAWIGAAAAAAIAGLFVVQLVLPDVVLASLPGLQAELVALLLAIPLGLVAWVVFGARDPRRFVVGAALAAVAWTAVLYPNIAALPLPSALVNAYQGILPTYLYPFQFPVNTDPAVSSSGLVTPESVLLGGALLFTSVVVAYAARGWRIARAEQAATPGGPDAPASTGSGWPDPI